MASDTMPGEAVDFGNGNHLSLNVPDNDRAETIFKALAEGGRVVMPFEKTFWHSLFGMCRDKFGVSWMVSSDVSS